MPYDISEIKKLPDSEKLRIIDEIWETIDNHKPDNEDISDEDPEVIALLQERIEKYERGEGVFYTEEEAKKISRQQLEDFRKQKNA